MHKHEGTRLQTHKRCVCVQTAFAAAAMAAPAVAQHKGNDSNS